MIHNRSDTDRNRFARPSVDRRAAAGRDTTDYAELLAIARRRRALHMKAWIAGQFRWRMRPVAAHVVSAFRSGQRRMRGSVKT
jgi:hypothetical protein